MFPLDKKYNFLMPIKAKNLARIGGRNGDGGYIVEIDTLKNTEILVSFGMGQDWSFEIEFIKENPDIKIFMYDHNVSALFYLKEIWKYFRRYITFRDKNEGLKTRINFLKNYLNFFKLKNVNFYKEKITYPIKSNKDTDIKKVFERIDRIKDMAGKKIFLKCDIEGDEFNIINEILKYEKRINALIFEFHWLDKNEEIFLKFMKRIQKNFCILHLHGNNHFGQLITGLPIVLEVSLINKINLTNEKYFIKSFPVKGLDKPNNPNKDDINFYFDV
jgi:hypothetical protein